MDRELDWDLCKVVGDSADRLVSTQIFMSGGSAELTTRNITPDLYDAARKIQGGEPLTYLAARALLERVKPRQSVIITCGFFDPPSMIDEGDGPVGAAPFAKSLCIALDATPVFLTEVANMGRMTALVQAMGLEVVDYRLAKTTPFKASVFPLPIDPVRAEREAKRLLDETQPAALVSIEKPSPGKNGHYHTGIGLRVTDVVGKINFVVDEARRRGVLTIGMGDGGNEVGLGKIIGAVEAIVPTGKTIGAVVDTDILVIGSIANWAAYAVEACMAAAMHQPEVMHSDADERRIVDAAARNGLIDPVTGISSGWIDGTPPICSASILSLLREMVKLRLARQRPESVVNFPKRWVQRGVADQTIKVWADELAKREGVYFGRK